MARSPMRSTSLYLPEVKNPFVFKASKLPWYRYVQMAVMTVTIVPLRLFAMGVCLVVAWLLASLALMGLSPEQLNEKPITGWRRSFVIPVCGFLGQALFCFGSISSVTIKGSPSSSKEAPIWVVAPHSSFIDVIFEPLYNYPSIVGKTTLGEIPFFGSMRVKKGAQYSGRLMCILIGWVWSIRGKQSSQKESVALVCAPHSTLFDGIIMFLAHDIPGGVTRLETAHMPIVGKLTKLSQPVFVYREDKDSRQKTIAEIKRRAHSNGLWQQFLIFPEGTTTNRKCLISFKAGAFIPGVPVQPVLLWFPDEWDTVTWTWDGPGAFMVLWQCLCKLYTRIEIEFMPVYIPNEAEKADPYLYAENVRQVMADQLGVPVSDHTYEDCRLMEYAKKAKFKIGDGLVEFRKIQKKLGLNYADLQKLLEKFCEMAQHSSTSTVTLETFSKYMGLPINNVLHELFNLYDRDGSGHIDFREYVIGMSLISEPANDDETVRLAFKLFDDGAKGYVTRDEFVTLLCDTLDASEEEAKILFSKVNASDDDHITYDQFKAYASEMPEYTALFTTYHRLKESSVSDLISDSGFTNSEENLKPFGVNQTQIANKDKSD